MANTPVISTITLPSGTTYYLKDADARSDIQDLKQSVTGAMHYIGITTTAISDGSTTATIVIDNVSKTLTASDAGSVVIYGEKEFVWNGTKWQEFGSTGSLKALAFKDSASATYTPAGTVSTPTFTGTAATLSVTSTPTGSVTISTGTGTTNYTPAGTVSQPSFTGTEGNVSVSGTPTGSVTITSGSTGTVNYTPAGTVSQPTTTVELNTTTVNSITAVGTLPSWSGTVTGEDLAISWSQGTLPTKGNDTSVATTVKSATTTQPTFSGTGTVLSASFSGSSTTSTGTFTPSGTVSQPTFSGTGTELKGTFAGNEGTTTVSYTPEGTISKPTFTGTEATIVSS